MQERLKEATLSLSRRLKFRGKNRILNALGMGMSRKDIVPPGIASVRCVEGITISTDCTSDIMFRELYVNGSYQDDVLLALRRLLRPGDVFWDVGANYGLMSLYVHKKFAGSVKSIAFEPSPIVVKELRRNLEQNGATSVEVVEACLSDRAGTVRFFTSSDHSWNATMVAEFAAQNAQTLEIEVESLTIDEAVKKLPEPSVFKIDVEGAEHLVVRGGAEFLGKKRPPIIAEYNVKAIADAALTNEEYLDLYRSLGYRVYALKRPLFGEHRWGTLWEVRRASDLPGLCNLIVKP